MYVSADIYEWFRVIVSNLHGHGLFEVWRWGSMW